MKDDQHRLELETFIPYRLSVLSNTVSGSIARLYASAFDMTIPEWRVMAVLGMAAPLSANQVAEKSRMDKVQVSRAVARLLDAGHVERDTDSLDRRRSHLRLSKTGEQVYNQIAPLALAAEARLLAALSPEELAQFEALLTKLQRNADEIAAEDGELPGVRVPVR